MSFTLLPGHLIYSVATSEYDSGNHNIISNANNTYSIGTITTEVIGDNTAVRIPFTYVSPNTVNNASDGLKITLTSIT